MKRIHVCLVSDQTIPNILAIEESAPDELLLISTGVMEGKGKSSHILDCLAARGMDYHDRHHIIKVAEDSLLDCHRQLESWIQDSEDSEFCINLTGGTKIMSIAAYAFFKDYGSRMIYIPIHRNEYITVFPKRGAQNAVSLPQRLSVLEYLKAYGLTVINARYLGSMAEQAGQRQELSRWIVARYEELKNLLVRLNEILRVHRGDRHFDLKDTFSGANGEERDLLRRMDFSLGGAIFKKNLSKTEIHYLTGGWLEEYCYNEVASFLRHGIDDAVISIQVRNSIGAENEFDVMFTKDNALYTIECKSLDQQEDKKADALYKVGALQKDFGLRVRSFLVSTSPHILKDGLIRPSIAARAEHLSTAVIPPHEVLHFRRHLADKFKLNG